MPRKDDPTIRCSHLIVKISVVSTSFGRLGLMRNDHPINHAGMCGNLTRYATFAYNQKRLRAETSFEYKRQRSTRSSIVGRFFVHIEYRSDDVTKTKTKTNLTAMNQVNLHCIKLGYLGIQAVISCAPMN